MVKRFKKEGLKTPRKKKKGGLLSQKRVVQLFFLRLPGPTI